MPDLQLAEYIRAPLTVINRVSDEDSCHSWIVRKQRGMCVFENKSEKKYNLERVFSKMRGVKVFLEPSLFDHYTVIFPQQHVTHAPSPYTHACTHVRSTPGQLL